MKSLLKLFIILLCVAFYSCKNNKDVLFQDYKYATDEQIIVCDNLDTKLYVEALLSFEADILNWNAQYNSNLSGAYTMFLRASSSSSNQVAYETIVSPHSMKVLAALKKKSELWKSTNKLDYKAPIFKCLTNNFIAKDFVRTINALTETNSVRKDVLASPLQKYIKMADRDKYLATYVALSLYYEQITYLDPALVTEKQDVNG